MFRDGHLLRLEPKVVDVLQLLVENAGRVVGKDALLRTVWRDAVVGESSLARTISLLRSTLGTRSSRHLQGFDPIAGFVTWCGALA